MPKLRVHNFSISMTGTGQDRPGCRQPTGGARPGAARVGVQEPLLAQGRAKKAARKGLTTDSSQQVTRHRRHCHGPNMFGPIRGP